MPKLEIHGPYFLGVTMSYIDKEHWDGNQILTHNALFNFILTSRGYGKTYWFKERAIKNWIKDKSMFMYIRRYRGDLKDIATFFNNINDRFPDIEITYKANKFYFNNELAGYAVALTKQVSMKSNDYSKVTLLCYDEFLIDIGEALYLPNEPRKLMSLYDTVSRGRDPIFFGFANAITVFNDYFKFFNIKVKEENGIYKTKDKLVLCQVYDSEIHKSFTDSTKFGKLSRNTEYYSYASENKFVKTINEFMVNKMSSDAKFLFSIKHGKRVVGIWADYESGFIFISNKIYKNDRLQFVTLTEDMKPNNLILKANKNYHFVKLLRKAYTGGFLFYESINLKEFSQEFLRYIL